MMINGLGQQRRGLIDDLAISLSRTRSFTPIKCNFPFNVNCGLCGTEFAEDYRRLIYLPLYVPYLPTYLLTKTNVAHF